MATKKQPTTRAHEPASADAVLGCLGVVIAAGMKLGTAVVYGLTLVGVAWVLSPALTALAGQTTEIRGFEFIAKFAGEKPVVPWLIAVGASVAYSKERLERMRERREYQKQLTRFGIPQIDS